VSWKLAALRKLSVSNDAFVMPSSTGEASAGFRLLLNAFIFRFELKFVHLFTPEESGVPGLSDANLAQHLAHNDFNVLVVDGHALDR